MKLSLCALASSLVLLGGCGTATAPQDTAAKMELRAYQVPTENTENLLFALRSNLNTGEKGSLGSVSNPAPGQLLVLAPANLQTSIADTLKALASQAKAQQTEAPAEQYRLQFWIVDALPGASQDDPALTGLLAATEETRKFLGPVHFVLRDTVSAISRAQWEVNKSWTSPSATSAESSIINKLRYKVFQVSGGLLMTFSFSVDVPHQSNNVTQYVSTDTSTTIPIRLGQTLVLSQGPTHDGPSDEKQTSSMATRLYIVRLNPVTAS